MWAHRKRTRGARIGTTTWAAVEGRATPIRSTRRTASAGLLTGVLVVLFGAALATAGPAAAVDDPTRPDARVTHGPSCRPGGLVVEVVAGTSPYSVRLATTRTPSGEDEASLQPGETVVLRTGDVAYGETIDGRLEFAAQDGTGVTFVDELEEYTFTRPTREDCDSIAEPTSPEAENTGVPSSTATPTTGGGAAPTSTSTTPTTTSSAGTPAAGGAAPGAGGGSSPPRAVTPGDSVPLQAGGFRPGEQVVIQLHGTDVVIATVTAAADGTVDTEIRIPADAESGLATMDLVGADSAFVAAVDLQVAAAEIPMTDDGAGDIVPLAAAAVALVAAVGGLVSVAGRRRTQRPTTSAA
jgi:hypothetical protein